MQRSSSVVQRRRPAKKGDAEHEKSGKWRRMLSERRGMLRRDSGTMMIVMAKRSGGEGETTDTTTSGTDGLKIAVRRATGLDIGAGVPTGAEAMRDGTTTIASKRVDQGNVAEVRKQGVAAGVRQDILRILADDAEEAEWASSRKHAAGVEHGTDASLPLLVVIVAAACNLPTHSRQNEETATDESQHTDELTADVLAIMSAMRSCHRTSTDTQLRIVEVSRHRSVCEGW